MNKKSIINLSSTISIIMLFVGCELGMEHSTYEQPSNSNSNYNYHNDGLLHYVNIEVTEYDSNNSYWIARGTLTNTGYNSVYGFQIQGDFYTDSTFSQFCKSSNCYRGDYSHVLVEPGETVMWSLESGTGSCNVDDYPNYAVTNIIAKRK